MNYFFVFQNKTFKEEYDGGYLWAPQHGKTGRIESHWIKMKDVRRGDIIIHSYKQQIVAISIAKRDVYAAKRPSEAFNEWQQEGWRVDSTYILFKKTILTSDFKERLLKLQPQKYAPFNKRGSGNTGYLFEANKSMFEFIIRQTASIQTTEQEKKIVLGLLNTRNVSQEDMTELEIEMDLEEAKARQLSAEELAVRTKRKETKKSQKAETIVYYRNPYLKEMVKQIAAGKCQMCSENAPFYDKDKKPYLEEHHVKRLADGGSDTMDNVVALCPNCHRKVHVLNDEQDTSVLKRIADQNEKHYQRLLEYAEDFTRRSSISNLEENREVMDKNEDHATQ